MKSQLIRYKNTKGISPQEGSVDHSKELSRNGQSFRAYQLNYFSSVRLVKFCINHVRQCITVIMVTCTVCVLDLRKRLVEAIDNLTDEPYEGKLLK